MTSRRLLRSLTALLAVAAGCVACSGDGGSRPGTSSVALSHAVSSANLSASPSKVAPRSVARRRPAGAPFRLAHLVIVVEENHSYADIARAHAPYLHRLIAGGTSMTNLFAIRHPSEPNYLALFSGSTQGLTNDSCPHRYGAANLASQVRAAHRTFVGYSEGLPTTGYRGCAHGRYVRRHVPWTNFRNVPGSVNRPLSDLPRSYAKLPSVSFVIPDLDHDMHDGTIAQADTWLRRHLGGYASWARAHNSALIVTWDEDDKSEHNKIPTIVYGSRVRHASYRRHADLYTLLRTVQWLYGLHPLAHSADRAPVSSIWTA